MSNVKTLEPPTTIIRRQLDPALRQRIAEAVDHLIAALDASEDTDQDTAVDDEPIDDDELEPSLGFVEQINQDKNRSVTSTEVDLEYDEADFEGDPDADQEGDGDCDAEDNGDAEPSLVSADGSRLLAAVGLIDGEEGDLPVAELDALRTKRRAVQPAPSDGNDAKFVSVSYSHGGRHRNVRPLTAEETRRLLGLS